jgi:hypothetical protein
MVYCVALSVFWFWNEIGPWNSHIFNMTYPQEERPREGVHAIHRSRLEATWEEILRSWELEIWLKTALPNGPIWWLQATCTASTCLVSSIEIKILG